MNRERHIIEDPTNKSDAEMEVSKHFEESLRRAKDKVQFMISFFVFVPSCYLLYLLLFTFVYFCFIFYFVVVVVVVVVVVFVVVLFRIIWRRDHETW